MEVANVIRRKVMIALDMLDRRKAPVEKLIMEQLEKDAAGTLQKLARYFPQEQDTNIRGALTIVAREYHIGRDRNPIELGAQAVSVSHMGSPDESVQAGSLRLASEGGERQPMPALDDSSGAD